MNGTIDHRPDRNKPWRGRYPGPDRRQRSRSFNTKREAQKWLREQIRRIDTGTWTNPSDGMRSYAEHADQLTLFWLPPYCPSLNLIERLWGHLRRTILANVLFRTIEDLVAAFRTGVTRINGRRDKMGFMFDHDDVRTKAA